MTLDLALVLTAAGATLSAALIAAIVQIVKRVPAFGAWLDAGREPAVVLVLSLTLVVYAGVATIEVWTLEAGFSLMLAWVGIAGLATKAYDVAPERLRSALGGA